LYCELQVASYGLRVNCQLTTGDSQLPTANCQLPTIMTAQDLFDKYYPVDSEARRYLYIHSLKVREVALRIASHKPHLKADIDIIRDASFLHDIGIFMTDAPGIGCYGSFPYVAHGYLGRELLEKEGFEKIALVCERHIGVGITRQEIIKKQMPLPHRDMVPVTIEEKIICYADKFFSKSEAHLTIPKSPEKIRKKLAKYGKSKVQRFNEMVDLFGLDFLKAYNQVH
jgi:uncharacterized protein